ncbi:MAG: hypothetical protein HS101_09890 [Planctomycetia bacterium]|nr:hypothetical protein [Planctomycetia bacterium]MCC7315714.1 hypothetical protein [Planctomycetota bacterium]OQY98804.1 MAG: hypothetical protein B6D36_17105 [Planctomycetes bacterium UTPLA1]
MNLAALNSSTPFAGSPATPASSALLADKPLSFGGRKDGGDFRKQVGEFVGNIFYGTLIQQMQASSLKTKYFSGGRGEEAFQGQLGIELAQRLGRSANNPVADKLASAIEKRLGISNVQTETPAATGKEGAE